uniref:Uncharacterized protein n=1 Tax=Arundo donax TaxID=35708 RepID=A0A0A9C5Q3_ARUDO
MYVINHRCTKHNNVHNSKLSD